LQPATFFKRDRFGIRYLGVENSGRRSLALEAFFLELVLVGGGGLSSDDATE
jgi:hypothetical protein